MDITPLDNSFILCEHWLSNAKNNILNKDILCLQIFYQENKEYSFIIISAGIINLILALFLIPALEAKGAALSVLLVEIYIAIRILVIRNYCQEFF